MSRRIGSTFCILFAFVSAALTYPAMAQTVANGSYYATPAWDQTLPANVRFIVLSNFENKAVLDRDTGLVWERSPDSTLFNLAEANEHCNKLAIAGRLGWRLPGIQDLASLIDVSTTLILPISGPRLRAGHPFVVSNGLYWSTTRFTFDAFTAWLVNMATGDVGGDFWQGMRQAMCVRGGPAADMQ